MIDQYNWLIYFLLCRFIFYCENYHLKLSKFLIDIKDYKQILFIKIKEFLKKEVTDENERIFNL